MTTSPRSWPMAPADDPNDAEVLDQAEPDFTLDGRCLTCLRFVAAGGECPCEKLS